MQFTPAELWAHMGMFARGVVALMAAMSLVSLAVALERLAVFFRSSAASRAFARRLAGPLERADLAGALEAAKAAGPASEQGYLGQVVGAGLVAWQAAEGQIVRGERELGLDQVARALERAGLRELQTLKRGLGLLATVASTAPFIGLLGTVMGIVSAFQSMAGDAGGGLAAVSGGIAEALVTTAFGLLVAIPAVALHNGLQGWVDARAVDLAEASNELLELLARLPARTPSTISAAGGG